MPKQIRRKKDKVYLAIFIVVAVVVGGISYWVLQKGNREIEENRNKIQEMEIKKGGGEEVGEIDTSNWETYVNEEYEVKGPAEWKSIELPEQNYMSLGKTIDSPLIEFNVLDNPSEYPPKEWLEDKNIDFTILEETTINGLSALKVSERLRMGDIPVTIYINKGKKLYGIGCVSDSPADLEIFNKIVNSFKLK